MQDEIRRIAEELGLPFGRREMTWNSRRSQELAAWADTRPGGQKLHDALYEAYFVDNLNIHELDVLLGLVDKAGLDINDARDVIEGGSFAARIDHDWSRARAQGLTGVPTMLSGETYVLGYHPLERIMRFVNHLRVLRDEQSG